MWWTPMAGTPLYDVTADAYDRMTSEYDPEKINAVVLLTDGLAGDQQEVIRGANSRPMSRNRGGFQ